MSLEALFRGEVSSEWEWRKQVVWEFANILFLDLVELNQAC